jgi:hypothetical protein
LLPSENEAPFHFSEAELKQYLAGPESEADGIIYESHLNDCPQCMNDLAVLTEANAQPVPVIVPEDLSSRTSWPVWTRLTPARVALAVAIWLHEAMAPTGPLAVALAILPALPLIGMIWAMGRLLVEEQDEYLRSLHVRQFMIATGFMLTVTCVWGFLETFELVPHVPMYWAFIIWCAGLGIGTMVNELRS